MTDALFITSDETRGLATAGEYVGVVREGYRQVGEGAPTEPRTQLTGRDPPGLLTTYVAILPETGAMGGYTYAAGFGDRDAHFVTPLFDADSGAIRAVIDGAHMNPYKTGAAGAVGTDALARADASTLAMVGSGPQAKGQLRGIATVRDLDRVDVYSPTKENRESFASEMNSAVDATVAAVASSAAAVEDADIVVTATNASDPVFDGDLLEPGAHVTAMGNYTVGKRELDDTTVATATYVLDLRARADRDAASLMAARENGAVGEDHLHGDLGEVLTGEAAGRTSDDEITVFDSGGTAVETVAAAQMLYERAAERGLGETLPFAPASEAME
ncbi:MAG: ornithine cyclodeaminase family protein [Haloferacaceae archaeon]